MKTFLVCFSTEKGEFINGFTEAENLAEAMKKIAEEFPDISFIHHFHENI